MRILSIGELLWDVIGDQEYLGGAPLNFSVSSQRLGSDVAFVSAIGADQRGALAIQLIQALGLSPRFIQIVPGCDTGAAFVTTDEFGSATFQIKRPAAFDFLNIQESMLSDFADMRPDWIYFGTLAQTDPRNETILHRLVARVPEAGCFYDMNLREGHWSLDLVQRLSRLASIIKLNESEAETLFRLTRSLERFSLEEFCRYWSSTYNIETICITLGGAGCAVFINGTLRTYPGYTIKVVDTVGAGDAFAAAFLHGLHLGWPVERIAPFANSLGALVASRAGATPAWTIDECLEFTGSPLNN